MDLFAVVDAIARRLVLTYSTRAFEVDCPPFVVGRIDRRLLEIALDNLLDNAVRHGFTGERMLRIRVRPERPEGAVRLLISDDGVRLDSARPVGGSGLGLGLARRAMRALEGDLTLEAGRDGGTLVMLSLPPGSSP